MKMKKWIALAMCLVLMISLAACRNKDKEQPEGLIQELPAIETAPQKNYTADQIRDMYNAALDKLAKAESYHMYGSTNSTSVYAEMLSSVVNSYDVKYAKASDGKLSVWFDSRLNSDGSDMSHSTYFDGELYYYDALGMKYSKTTNDYQDFHAMDYLMPLKSDMELKDFRAMDQLDGSVEINFTLPMGDYMSDAVLTLVGFTSETFETDPVHVSFTLDAEGTMTYFYISYSSAHIFLEEQTEQTIIVSMSLDGYNGTTVDAPADLDSYELFSEEEIPDEEHDGVGILSPEDVN